MAREAANSPRANASDAKIREAQPQTARSACARVWEIMLSLMDINGSRVESKRILEDDYIITTISRCDLFAGLLIRFT